MAPKSAEKYTEAVVLHGKDNVARLFSSILIKTIFNIFARTVKFKMTYVRIALCTCIHGVIKFCSSDG